MTKILLITGFFLIFFNTVSFSQEKLPKIDINPFKSYLPEPQEEIIEDNKSDEQEKARRSVENERENIGDEERNNITEQLPEVIQPPTPTLPELVISGIVWNSDRPQAIVDGQVIDIGDTIRSVTIVNITKEGVEISANGISKIIGQEQIKENPDEEQTQDDENYPN